MKIDWKIWNYKGRKVALAHFVLCCLAALAYGWILWAFPKFGNENLFIISIICVAIVLACFFGYRAFCFSDDWFRAKGEQKAIWWNKHPRLSNAISALGWLVYFSIIIYLLWRTYRK